MNSIDINLKNVSKSYDGKIFVIDGIDLYIPAGQRTILLGPSGCGKTTLLRMISGLESITDGELYMVSGIIKSFLMHIRNIVKDLDLLLNIWMFQQKKLKRVQSGLDRWQSNFDERRKRWILSLVSYRI